MADPHTLARELASAYEQQRLVAAPPSEQPGGLDLATAYAVEAELVRLREAAGQRTAGRKVGYANRAMWRALKLETLVWAHMYDTTVRRAVNDSLDLSIARMTAPKIEPEIVFRLQRPIEAGAANAIDVLAAVEWIALGFEIIDSVFADWKFSPADFVASGGLHAGLIIGTPLPVTAANMAVLSDQLAAFTVTLSKDGVAAASGSAKNVLRSPALCLSELASALSRQPAAAPLAAGELISSGTLTESQFIAAGQTWTAAVTGLDLPALTVRTIGD